MRCLVVEVKFIIDDKTGDGYDTQVISALTDKPVTMEERGHQGDAGT